MKLIGITGRAGAGKDTIADYLVREHAFLKLSMAGPLKAGLTAMGLPEPANRDDKEKPVPGFSFTWREAAQKLGTEFGRGLDPEIWIKLMRQQMVGRESYGPLDISLNIGRRVEPRFVISDIRFENEAAMVRDLGGLLIHVTGRAADLGANGSHASEAGITFVTGDRYIINDRTMADLHGEIGYILKEYL